MKLNHKYIINKWFIALILFLLFFVSCSPKLTILNGEKINTNNILADDIYVFGSNQDIPPKTKILGKIETKGNFFTSMEDYRVNESMALIKMGAKELGGNAVKIEKITFPGPFKSKSYDIIAEVLLIEEQPKDEHEVIYDSIINSADCINLYRTNNLFGSGISYPVYINNCFIGGLDNNSKFTIILKNKSKNTHLQIESYGELYTVPIISTTDVLYLKCIVRNDGSPKIKIKEKTKGKKEFEGVKKTP